MSAETYPVRWAGRLAVVSMPAEIDLTNAPQILERLLSVLDRAPVTVIVDMTATGFCDSAGVTALLRASKQATAQQAEIRLAAPARAVRRIFTVTGLDRMLSIYPSLPAALAAGPPTAGAGVPPAGAGEPPGTSAPPSPDTDPGAASTPAIGA